MQSGAVLKAPLCFFILAQDRPFSRLHAVSKQCPAPAFGRRIIRTSGGNPAAGTRRAQPFPHKAAEWHHRDTKQKPKQTVKWTDLSQQVSFPPGIVPHAQPAKLVDNNAEYKFHRRQKRAARRAFFNQRTAGHAQIRQIQKQKTNSACQRHRPMCKSTPENFNRAVSNRTDCTDRRIFTQFFHTYHPAIGCVSKIKLCGLKKVFFDGSFL